jgi:hypothetical protein
MILIDAFRAYMEGGAEQRRTATRKKLKMGQIDKN